MTKSEAERIKAQKLKTFFWHIQRTYGLSEAGYRALYAAQGGRCYICRKATGKGRMLAVDHDHVTGEVRGLLCSGSLSADTCNRLIAKYSRQALARAVAYMDPMVGPPARTILAALEYQRAEDLSVEQLAEARGLTIEQARAVVSALDRS